VRHIRLLPITDPAGEILRDEFELSGTYLYFWSFAAFSTVLWGGTLIYMIKFKKFSKDLSRWELLLMPLILIIVVTVIVFEPRIKGEWTLSGIFNLVFLFHCVMFILRGCRHVSMKLTVCGCLLFALIAVTRYVDLLHSLIMRSLVFLIIGSSIFVAGIFYSRAKKQIQKGAS